MKKNMNNKTRITGWLYQHSLEERTYSEQAKNPGAKYIQGNVDIATDDAMTNIISVHFSFVSEPNADTKPIMKTRYEMLANIMNGTVKSVMADGADNAAKLSIDSAIGLSEWYDKNDAERLVSAKRNEGGFIRVASNPMPSESERNTFDVDMIIIGAKRVEADEERSLPEKVVVSGYIFDFRKAIMPVDFNVYMPGAMNYFEGLEPSKSNPVFTHLKGEQVSSTVVRKITEESAFGEDRVREVTNTRRDWVITWAAKEEYEWDLEETITNEEVKKALGDRETYLADLKSRRQNADGAFAAEEKATTKGKYNIKKSDAFDF